MIKGAWRARGRQGSFHEEDNTLSESPIMRREEWTGGVQAERIWSLETAWPGMLSKSPSRGCIMSSKWRESVVLRLEKPAGARS